MPVLHPYTIFPLGDSALTIDFGIDIEEEINDKVLHLYQLINDQSFPFITDLVPAYSSLAIYYDCYYFIHRISEETIFEQVAKKIEKLTSSFFIPNHISSKRTFRIPVCYSEKHGPDLIELSERNSLSIEEIITLHTSRTYRVYMLGFLPGFAYLGQVDERLATDRKAQPRLNVIPGSVGIAGKQTGVYPLTCPGGWQLIGKTPTRFFDSKRSEPVLLQPGDEVIFYSISEDELGSH